MIRSLVVVFFMLILCGCDQLYTYMTTGEISRALRTEVREKHNTEVAIVKLTGFEWDELFFFGPYTPAEHVCKRLEVPPSECSRVVSWESTDDGEMTMAFRNKGKVVHIETHLRFYGDFLPTSDQPFTPDSAVFIVKKEGKSADGEDWLKLRPRAEMN